MRLWSLHPRYLDSRGLVALWREALLARKVLGGEATGYRNHPQMKRFRKHPDPLKAIEQYLIEVWKEGKRRGYHFNRRKLGDEESTETIPVTIGQLRYEYGWLCKKVGCRDFYKYQELMEVRDIATHPLFRVVKGGVEEWERVRSDDAEEMSGGL